jgi:Protein of unknown function (DUF1501)
MLHQSNISNFNRRHFLSQLGSGFGSVALAGLLQRESAVGGEISATQLPTFAPKVKRVIQLFMNGGASPMDTFDYKPELTRHHGEMLGPKEKPEGQTGVSGAVMKSPFEFKQYGQSGRWVSSVFPHQAKWVDDMAFLMAMTTKTNVHGPASYMMNTGFLLPGFPCLGAWVSYALGSITDNLPDFIVLPDARGLPYNQKGNFSAGFLPARHQGTLINAASPRPVPDLFPAEKFTFTGGNADRRARDLLQKMNYQHVAEHPGDSRLEARIAAGELAAKMQLSAPEAFDLNSESEAMRCAYGMGQPVTDDFGRRCLLARRLIERGTRFVQVWSGPQGAVNNWDNHGNIQTELNAIAASVDLPIAALLGDLKQRGLLEDTLVIWTTEFGRTPFAQASLGRDHNGGSFVTWLAGAGIQTGVAHGASDDFGGQAMDGVTWCYDLHATVLHLMGLNHEKLAFRTMGVDRRLTDVHGQVVREILC